MTYVFISEAHTIQYARNLQNDSTMTIYIKEMV